MIPVAVAHSNHSRQIIIPDPLIPVEKLIGCHRTIAAAQSHKEELYKPPKRSLKPDPKNNIWKTSGVIYIYGFPLVHIQHGSFKVMSQCL
jgi:hypothetical protein